MVCSHIHSRDHDQVAGVYIEKSGVKMEFDVVGGSLARVGAGPDGRVRVDDGWEI